MRVSHISIPLVAVSSQLVLMNLLASECDVSLRANRTKIFPFEPIGFVLAIESHANTNMQKVSSRWSSFRFAKVDGDRHVKWRTFAPFGVHATLSPPAPLSLQPGQEITDFCLMHVGFTGDHVFNEPGLFLVQAGTPFGSSNVVTIEVVEPDSTVPAVELIGESRLFMLFDYYAAKSMPATKESIEALSVSLKKLRAMPTAFPYKAWFSVCEYALMEMRANNSTTKESRQIQQNQYFQIAKQLPSPQKECLLLAIASAQLEINDMHAAKNTFSWLATNTEDEYFSCLAKYQLDVLMKTLFDSGTN